MKEVPTKYDANLINSRWGNMPQYRGSTQYTKKYIQLKKQPLRNQNEISAKCLKENISNQTRKE